MQRSKWIESAVAAAICLGGSSALAADHLDSKSVMEDPAADITDVYAWAQGSNLVLVLDVAPLATASSKFSDAVQYALHLESSSGYGKSGDKMDIICTFDAEQKVSCWVGDKDYVTGDASDPKGLSSESGKVKVYAGLRADPFYFNLEGFKDTVATVDAAEGALTFDSSGCPAVDAATSAVLVGQLQGTQSGTMPAKNFFETANVLSIVIEVDKGLVTSGGTTVAVWGSTHKGG